MRHDRRVGVARGELDGEPKIAARGVRGLSTGNGFGNYLLADAKRVVTSAVAGASRQTVGLVIPTGYEILDEWRQWFARKVGMTPKQMTAEHPLPEVAGD